ELSMASSETNEGWRTPPLLVSEWGFQYRHLSTTQRNPGMRSWLRWCRGTIRAPAQAPTSRATLAATTGVWRDDPESLGIPLPLCYHPPFGDMPIRANKLA